MGGLFLYNLIDMLHANHNKAGNKFFTINFNTKLSITFGKTTSDLHRHLPVYSVGRNCCTSAIIQIYLVVKQESKSKEAELYACQLPFAQLKM